jgi:hypothetical protein
MNCRFNGELQERKKRNCWEEASRGPRLGLVRVALARECWPWTSGNLIRHPGARGRLAAGVRCFFFRPSAGSD